MQRQMSKFVQPVTTHGLPGISKILAEKLFRFQVIANGFLCLIPRFYVDVPLSGSYIYEVFGFQCQSPERRHVYFVIIYDVIAGRRSQYAW